MYLLYTILKVSFLIMIIFFLSLIFATLSSLRHISAFSYRYFSWPFSMSNKREKKKHYIPQTKCLNICAALFQFVCVKVLTKCRIAFNEKIFPFFIIFFSIKTCAGIIKVIKSARTFFHQFLFIFFVKYAHGYCIGIQNFERENINVWIDAKLRHF